MNNAENGAKQTAQATGKKTQYLPFHPNAPLPPAKKKLPPLTKIPKVTPKPTPKPTIRPKIKCAEIDWQIKWMNEFDASRRELNGSIGELKEENKKKSSEIDALKKQIDDQNKLMTKLMDKLDAKNVKIKKIKDKCALSHKEKVECVDMVTQMDAITTKDASTQTDLIESDDKPGISASIQLLPEHHEYATTPRKTVEKAVPKKEPKLLRCPDCTYFTTKKSSLDDHREESCINKPIKNMQCKICLKFFTYRSLRVHLNQYVSGKHKHRDEHAKYTPEQHKTLLDEHKMLKRPHQE